MTIALDNPFLLSLGILVFLLLVKKPEIALAIEFNGTFIYFYLIYKLGMEPSPLLTGSFHAFLAISYILGGMLVHKKYKFRVSSIDLIFIVFFLIVFLSYLILGKTSTKIAYAPLLVIAPYFGIQLLGSEKKIKNFFNYCIIVTAILIVPAFYELLFNPIFAESARYSMYMLEGGKDNPILFGMTIAVLLIILFILVLEQKKLKFKYLILIVPSLFLLLRSGSRGSTISFLVTMLFYILIIERLKFKTKVYALILLAFLILGTYKFIPESTIEFYKYTFTPEARIRESSSVYQRLVLIQEAFSDIKKSPIWGIGTGNSAGGYGSPHNILLEVLVEWGVIGLFIFLLLCYLTIKTALSFLRAEEQQDLNLLMKLSFVLFIYFLVRSMVGGYVTQYTGFFVSMGLISILGKIRKPPYSRIVL